MLKYMAVAVAVAVSEGGAVAVAVPVAGLTKRFFNHIQKDFLINVWGCSKLKSGLISVRLSLAKQLLKPCDRHFQGYINIPRLRQQRKRGQRNLRYSSTIFSETPLTPNID